MPLKAMAPKLATIIHPRTGETIPCKVESVEEDRETGRVSDLHVRITANRDVDGQAFRKNDRHVFDPTWVVPRELMRTRNGEELPMGGSYRWVVLA